MPGIAPTTRAHWVPARPVERSFLSQILDFFHGFTPRAPTQVTRAPVAPPKTFEQELRLGLQYFAPVATKSGVNGSFFLCDSRGQRVAIFKPMNMEAGAKKNHRLDHAHNVQFRKSILPGQGAGNEVLASALDSKAFQQRYGIPKTTLIRLAHPAFEGEELGSVQQFIPNSCSLSSMTSQQRARIPQHEWEKLNFRLISGSTDAHLGNMLYCENTQKLHLIDSGDDFVGEEGECQYYNPWAAEHRCTQKMSQTEYSFLTNLNVQNVMKVFEEQALINEETDSKLRVTADKYLTQILRILLANTVGKHKLTQEQWARLMSPFRGAGGQLHRSALEKIYDLHIRPHSKKDLEWRKVYPSINWEEVKKSLEAVALQIGRL